MGAGRNLALSLQADIDGHPEEMIEELISPFEMHLGKKLGESRSVQSQIKHHQSIGLRRDIDCPFQQWIVILEWPDLDFVYLQAINDGGAD